MDSLWFAFARTGYKISHMPELDANLLSKQLIVPIKKNSTSSCLPHLGKLNINGTVAPLLDLHDRLILVILQGHL